MSKTIDVTAFRYNELSESVRERLRTRDSDRQGEMVNDVSERLTGMLEELTGASVTTPNSRTSGELTLEWSLSNSQGDGVAFYGRVDAEGMLAALTKEDRSSGWIDDLSKISGAEEAITVLRTLGDGYVEISRNSFGHHYSHYNTMQFDCYRGAPVIADTEGPEKTWTFYGHWSGSRLAIEYYEEGDHQDNRVDTGHHSGGLWAASASGPTVEIAEARAKAEYEDEELLTEEQEAPLVEFFRNVSRFLEREGYDFLEALDEDTEWERFYAGAWFDGAGHVLEWDEDEAREAHQEEIEMRQANAYKAAHPDEFPWVISDSKGVEPGQQIPIINRLSTHNEAAAWIGTLPEYETGRYNLDGPSEEGE